MVELPKHTVVFPVMETDIALQEGVVNVLCSPYAVPALFVAYART
jgi:hypothetical protein